MVNNSKEQQKLQKLRDMQPGHLESQRKQVVEQIESLRSRLAGQLKAKQRGSLEKALERKEAELALIAQVQGATASKADALVSSSAISENTEVETDSNVIKDWYSQAHDDLLELIDANSDDSVSQALKPYADRVALGVRNGTTVMASSQNGVNADSLFCLADSSIDIDIAFSDIQTHPNEPKHIAVMSGNRVSDTWATVLHAGMVARLAFIDREDRTHGYAPAVPASVNEQAQSQGALIASRFVLDAKLEEHGGLDAVFHSLIENVGCTEGDFSGNGLLSDSDRTLAMLRDFDVHIGGSSPLSRAEAVARVGHVLIYLCEYLTRLGETVDAIDYSADFYSIVDEYYTEKQNGRDDPDAPLSGEVSLEDMRRWNEENVERMSADDTLLQYRSAQRSIHDIVSHDFQPVQCPHAPDSSLYDIDAALHGHFTYGTSSGSQSTSVFVDDPSDTRLVVITPEDPSMVNFVTPLIRMGGSSRFGHGLSVDSVPVTEKWLRVPMSYWISKAEEENSVNRRGGQIDETEIGLRSQRNAADILFSFSKDGGQGFIKRLGTQYSQFLVAAHSQDIHPRNIMTIMEEEFGLEKPLSPDEYKSRLMFLHNLYVLELLESDDELKSGYGHLLDEAGLFKQIDVQQFDDIAQRLFYEDHHSVEHGAVETSTDPDGGNGGDGPDSPLGGEDRDIVAETKNILEATLRFYRAAHERVDALIKENPNNAVLQEVKPMMDRIAWGIVEKNSPCISSEYQPLNSQSLICFVPDEYSTIGTPQTYASVENDDRAQKRFLHFYPHDHMLSEQWAMVLLTESVVALNRNVNADIANGFHVDQGESVTKDMYKQSLVAGTQTLDALLKSEGGIDAFWDYVIQTSQLSDGSYVAPEIFQHENVLIDAVTVLNQRLGSRMPGSAKELRKQLEYIAYGLVSRIDSTRGLPNGTVVDMSSLPAVTERIFSLSSDISTESSEEGEESRHWGVEMNNAEILACYQGACDRVKSLIAGSSLRGSFTRLSQNLDRIIWGEMSAGNLKMHGGSSDGKLSIYADEDKDNNRLFQVMYDDPAQLFDLSLSPYPVSNTWANVVLVNGVSQLDSYEQAGSIEDLTPVNDGYIGAASYLNIALEEQGGLYKVVESIIQEMGNPLTDFYHDSIVQNPDLCREYLEEFNLRLGAESVCNGVEYAFQLRALLHATHVYLLSIGEHTNRHASMDSVVDLAMQIYAGMQNDAQVSDNGNSEPSTDSPSDNEAPSEDAPSDSSNDEPPEPPVEVDNEGIEVPDEDTPDSEVELGIESDRWRNEAIRLSAEFEFIVTRGSGNAARKDRRLFRKCIERNTKAEEGSRAWALSEGARVLSTVDWRDVRGKIDIVNAASPMRDARAYRDVVRATQTVVQGVHTHVFSQTAAWSLEERVQFVHVFDAFIRRYLSHQLLNGDIAHSITDAIGTALLRDIRVDNNSEEVSNLVQGFHSLEIPHIRNQQYLGYINDAREISTSYNTWSQHITDVQSTASALNEEALHVSPDTTVLDVMNDHTSLLEYIRATDKHVTCVSYWHDECAQAGIRCYDKETDELIGRECRVDRAGSFDVADTPPFLPQSRQSAIQHNVHSIRHGMNTHTSHIAETLEIVRPQVLERDDIRFFVVEVENEFSGIEEGLYVCFLSASDEAQTDLGIEDVASVGGDLQEYCEKLNCTGVLRLKTLQQMEKDLFEGEDIDGRIALGAGEGTTPSPTEEGDGESRSRRRERLPRLRSVRNILLRLEEEGKICWDDDTTVKWRGRFDAVQPGHFVVVHVEHFGSDILVGDDVSRSCYVIPQNLDDSEYTRESLTPQRLKGLNARQVKWGTGRRLFEQKLESALNNSMSFLPAGRGETTVEQWLDRDNNREVARALFERIAEYLSTDDNTVTPETLIFSDVHSIRSGTDEFFYGGSTTFMQLAREIGYVALVTDSVRERVMESFQRKHIEQPDEKLVDARIKGRLPYRSGQRVFEELKQLLFG